MKSYKNLAIAMSIVSGIALIVIAYGVYWYMKEKKAGRIIPAPVAPATTSTPSGNRSSQQIAVPAGSVIPAGTYVQLANGQVVDLSTYAK